MQRFLIAFSLFACADPFTSEATVSTGGAAGAATSTGGAAGDATSTGDTAGTATSTGGTTSTGGAAGAATSTGGAAGTATSTGGTTSTGGAAGSTGAVAYCSDWPQYIPGKALGVSYGTPVTYKGKRYLAQTAITYASLDCVPDAPAEWCANWFSYLDECF